MSISEDPKATAPLESLDVWEEDLLERYPTEEHVFRDYKSEVRPSVKEFYRLRMESYGTQRTRPRR